MGILEVAPCELVSDDTELEDDPAFDKTEPEPLPPLPHPAIVITNPVNNKL